MTDDETREHLPLGTRPGTVDLSGPWSDIEAPPRDEDVFTVASPAARARLADDYRQGRARWFQPAVATDRGDMKFVWLSPCGEVDWSRSANRVPGANGVCEWCRETRWLLLHAEHNDEGPMWTSVAPS